MKHNIIEVEGVNNYGSPSIIYKCTICLEENRHFHRFEDECKGKIMQDEITMTVRPDLDQTIRSVVTDLTMLLGDMSWLIEVRCQEVIYTENESDEVEEKVEVIILVVRQFLTAMEAMYLLSKVLVDELDFPEQLTEEEATLQEKLREPITYHGIPVQLCIFYIMPFQPGCILTAASSTPAPNWKPKILWEAVDREKKESWIQGPEEMLRHPHFFNFVNPEDSGGLQG